MRRWLFTRVEQLLNHIIEKEYEMAVTLSEILAKVQQEQTVIESVKALLQLLSQMLKDALAANDPVKMQEVANLIDANIAKLTQSVIDNTPAA